MADTTTTTYGLTKPEVGASEDTWGDKLNTNLDSIDDLLDGTTTLQGTKVDDTFKMVDNDDATKQVAFSAGSITTATTRTFTWPDASGTFVLLDASQTLTGKTLTSPAINTGTISGGTIDNAVIGGTTPVAADFTTVQTTSTATFGGLVTASGQLDISQYIRHVGDTNSQFGFPAADNFRVFTNGSERLDITNSGMQLGNTGARVNQILDEDNMATNSATALATQQSIKAYVDSNSGGFTAATTGGVATTSGTTVTLTTSIPADVKQIVVTFNGVGINSIASIQVQLGDSGGFETGGYLSTSTRTNGSTTVSSTSGFIIASAGGHVLHGSMILTRHEVTNDIWVAQHAVRLDGTNVASGGGSKSLTTDVTQIRLANSGGNSFDAGEANVLWM